MKKMNKKGFTLIEMLAVIAIIAVLVAIIVPAVGSSTAKATASANAANLRSVMAEVATKRISEPDNYPVGSYTSASGVVTFVDGTTDVTMNVPVAKGISVTGCTIADEAEMTIVIAEDRITASYAGDGTIEILSEVAETGKYVAE